MNIIEKLGFTPGPWIRSVMALKSAEHIGATQYIATQELNYYGRSEKEIKRSVKDLGLCAAAPDMLEALIQVYSVLFDDGSIGSISDKSVLSVIEKATDIKWEDIKELV